MFLKLCLTLPGSGINKKNIFVVLDSKGMDVACVDDIRHRVDNEIIHFLRRYGYPAPISWSKVSTLYHFQNGHGRFLIGDPGNACYKVIN